MADVDAVISTDESGEAMTNALEATAVRKAAETAAFLRVRGGAECVPRSRVRACALPRACVRAKARTS